MVGTVLIVPGPCSFNKEGRRQATRAAAHAPQHQMVADPALPVALDLPMTTFLAVSKWLNSVSEQNGKTLRQKALPEFNCY